MASLAVSTLELVIVSNTLCWLDMAKNDMLIRELGFYGAYHANPINQLIHVIFVPAIWWSSIVWLVYTPALAEVPEAISTVLPPVISDNLKLDFAFLVFAAYALYYIYLDFFGGLTASVYLGALYVYANAFVAAYGREDAWWLALIVHIFSWIIQVSVGHGVFEGRKPALLDSFFQALILAPLFVWFEVLFFFGLCRGLKAEMDAKVKELKGKAE